MARISSAPTLPRVPSAVQLLGQRSATFPAAAPQPPMFQASALPNLAPEMPSPEPHVPAELDTRSGGLSNSGSQHFEVTDADMLDALHAITGKIPGFFSYICISSCISHSLLHCTLGCDTTDEQSIFEDTERFS